MWKFVTRSIRETFERRTCRTNIYSQSTHDGNSNNNEQKEFLAPSFSKIYYGCFGNTNHTGPKEKEDQSKYHAKFTWIDAVSWSSFLAVGYVVCQSFCIHRKLFEIDNKNLEQWRNKFLICPQSQTLRYFNQYLLPQRNQILVVSNKFKESKSTVKIFNSKAIGIQKLYGPFTSLTLTVNNELNESENTVEFLDNTSSFQNFYGPITAQEAFEKAANEFSNTHQMVMGELELDCGSKALDEKRYEDALEHFITGTELSSAGSMFNLALCYELGLGTSIDYGKAVKYYKRAANKGHIDAIYNLGVFYAQGKGGLKRNKDMARQLFTKAAKYGQIQALKALQLEETFNKNKNLKTRTKYILNVKATNSGAKKNVFMKLNGYDDILKINLNDETAESDKFINSFNESINLKSPTDIFLEMINVHQ